MTIKEAIQKRIPRIRRPMWANTDAYLRLPLLANGMSGPWAELYDPTAQRILDIPVGTQRIMVIGIEDADDYEQYSGPAHPEEANNYAKTYTES